MLDFRKNGLASFLGSGLAAATLLVATLTHVPATAAIPGTLDHFKCYKVVTPRGVANYPGKDIVLEDQFGERTMKIGKSQLLCNPVDKDGEGILEPTAHLTCYKAKEDKRGDRFQSVDVVLENQFGQQTVTLRKAKRYCVPTEKDDEGAPPAGLDGFSCYKAKNTKGTPKFEPLTIRLTDQFEEKFFDVLGVHSMCAPTAEVHEMESPSTFRSYGVNDPASHLTCFKIKQRIGEAAFEKRIVTAENKLETTSLLVKKARLLCVPSEKIIIAKDQDGDGFTPGDLDCDDNNSAINPDAEEICDGLDNNCDGQIDETFPETGTACYTPGDDSHLYGVCMQGTNVCNGGLLTCDGEVTPTTESCDGVDSNCNNVDDATENAGGGGACDTTLLGACAAGTEVCNGTGLDCVPDNEPAPEVCNNLIDEDCDGLVDEPSPEIIEVCNGIDDNCNAQIDEGDVGQDQPCTADAFGTCAEGTTYCDGLNGIQCAPSAPAPSDTTCDGVDENCNGTADEGYVSGACDTGLLGACSTGASSCELGAESCNQTVFPAPSDTTCDNVDEDCDGGIDEDYVSDFCSTGNTTPGCEFGQTVCSGGGETCQPPPGCL